jgi:hypothetical protein
LIGLLFAAAAGVMIAIVFSLIAEQEPTSTIPTFEPTVAPTETVTEAPVPTAVVLLTDVIGKNVADASIFLKERGLLVDAVPGEALDPADPRILTVYRADGLGQVPIGSTVRIFYYIQQAAGPSPTPAPPTQEPEPDGSITIPLPTTTGSPLPTSTSTPTEGTGGTN